MAYFCTLYFFFFVVARCLFSPESERLDPRELDLGHELLRTGSVQPRLTVHGSICLSFTDAWRSSFVIHHLAHLSHQIGLDPALPLTVSDLLAQI